MKKLVIAFLLLGSLSGCAYTSSIKDGGDVYNRAAAANAPRVAIMDLTDSRSNPTHIGQVAALAMKEPKTPMNVILTNRIASKLAEQGFSVQKVSNLSANSTILITGNMNDFFVKSFDALMEAANGQVSYSIKIIDAQGKTLFEKPFVAYASHFIGLTGQFGSDKAIDKTIDAAVDQIFADDEFMKILQANK